MNTARTGGPEIPGMRRSASKERIWRPKALRAQRQSAIPRWSRSSMIMPAQVPRIGVPVAANSRSGSPRPSRSIPSVIVVDSPPGITRPSRPSSPAGVRTSRTSAPSPRSIRAWAWKSPCRARTPTSGMVLPAPVGEQLAFLELARLEGGHRGAEALRGARDARRVLEVGGGLDDRAGADRGLGGLEDARADEHALGAELHHQRRVGRGGDAAGAEQHDRELAVARDLADQVKRRLVLLGGRRELGVVHHGQRADLAVDAAH